LRDATLAALFDGKTEMVNGVFGRVGYADRDLTFVTFYRPEIANLPDKLFNVLDRMKTVEDQGMAVRDCVDALFNVKKHALVIPLMDALGRRTFRSDGLKELAIQVAFWEGAERGIKDVVEGFYDYSAITAEKYAHGLSAA
jgi:hypothetical protein